MKEGRKEGREGRKEGREGREPTLVVEVVVALAHRENGCDDRVLCSVLVREGFVAPVVRQGVDEEGRVVHKDEASDGSIEVAATPVSPAKPAHHSGEEEPEDKG